jgi:hypothetical protein
MGLLRIAHVPPSIVEPTVSARSASGRIVALWEADDYLPDIDARSLA